MSSERSRSTASTISAAERPNFDLSPVDSTHLPAPRLASRARTPMWGLMPSSAAVLITRSISWKRSITITGVRPRRWARSAVST